MNVRESTIVDSGEVRALLEAFYEVISFEDGSTPDWPRMAELFSQHARITRVTPEAIDYMDLETFRGMAEEMIEVGAFSSFYEREIARRIDRYGQVIHVASAYETKISETAADYIGQGVNSLQLIHEAGAWKIVSLCWDDSAPFSREGLQCVSSGSDDHGQS
jgi:hypothetical protein